MSCCAVLLVACTAGTGDDGNGTFVLPSTDDVTCQEHQPDMPGTAYTGGVDADTARIFELLKYWTEHGSKAYCDGEPSTSQDDAWRAQVERLQRRSPAGTDSATTEPAPTTT